jgi:HEAT repeat protein
MKRSVPLFTRSLILICLSVNVAHSQTSSTVSFLRNNLKDSDVTVRLSAASDLAELGPDAKEAIPDLIETLKDRNEDVRLTTVDALTAIGKDAIGPLIEATKSDNVDIRWGAAEAIRRIGPEAKDALPQLTKLLEDKDEVIRLRAAYSMSVFGLGGRAAVPILVDALQHENADERTRAVEGLQRIGLPAVPSLTRKLEDPNPKVRNSAAEALGKIGSDARDAVPNLIKVLKDPDASVRRHAAAALGNFWPQADVIAPHLLEALDDWDPTVIKAASHAMARLGQVARIAIPSLTNLSRSHFTLVRRSAAEALGDIAAILYDYGSRSDIAPLQAAHQVVSTSEDPEVSKHAVRIKRTLDYLNLRSWGDIVEWMRGHPYWTMAGGFYPSLLLVCLLLFWLRPGWFLPINDKLGNSVDFQLPSWLSGSKVPTRYALLVGFFHHRTRVLDAWVSRYAANAQRQFLTKVTVEERKVHVSSPVRIDKQSVPNLTPQSLRPTFSKNRTCLLLLGEGGSGKTSLACQLARWGMADSKEDRLTPNYYMLPILIEQNVGTTSEADSSLLAIIRNQLPALIDASDAPPDGLIRELLKRKRLLVIVDSFSEMPEASQTNVLAGINELRVNACLITSRTEVTLNTRTLVEPLPRNDRKTRPVSRQ